MSTTKAAAIFESAAVAFPRADYRPSWLYWSGRAHERLGHLDAAMAGYRRTISFYRNSYYGRQATRRADALQRRSKPAPAASPALPVSPLRIDPGLRPPDRFVPLIRALLTAELFEDAVAELRWTARQSGSSPFIEASIAYALNRQGELRPAITAMRRAYPAVHGRGRGSAPVRDPEGDLPARVLGAASPARDARSLDPYLVAALVAQESTFQADVQSVANAWGLMQVVPATGRRYARRIGIPRFSTRRLTDPEVNVRIGTAFFSDLLRRYGGDRRPGARGLQRRREPRGALAAERPDFEQDEFIDDIPFPETQNYVKRILGTAEDYRLLYGRTSGATVRESSR